MKELVDFIRKCREKGFDDYVIRKALLDKGWPEDVVNKGFLILHKVRQEKIKRKIENKITIYLDSDVEKALEKRAKKNLLSIPEQIEDILRRSVVSGKKTSSGYKPKLDDKLVEIFSREKRGKKKK